MGINFQKRACINTKTNEEENANVSANQIQTAKPFLKSGYFVFTEFIT